MPRPLLLLAVWLSFAPLVLSRYTPHWSSLDTRPLPAWYDAAKFGIFVHWGVYSVPGYRAPDATGGAEWYWFNLHRPRSGTSAFHNVTYGASFTYPEFAPLWKAELFNATEWARLFKDAGAQYVIPTTKHHEGFPLWSSAQSWNWNSVDLGPKRELIQEIIDAVRAEGMRAGTYFSLYEWFNPLYHSDVDTYVDQHLLPQWRDLVTRFAPDILWCDGDWEHNSTVWRSEEFVAWLFNDSPTAREIVINDRFGLDCRATHGSFWTPEHSTDVNRTHKWELCTTIDTISWGINRASNLDDYLSSDQLIQMLARTVSNGGNMLLDVGPNADGSINSIQQERLRAIGAWLRINGEAIYNTALWRAQQEGDDIDNTAVRYTAAKDADTVFALLVEWSNAPPPSLITLTEPRANNQSSQNPRVSLNGFDGTVTWKWLNTRHAGIVVQLPSLPNNSTLRQQPILVLRLDHFI